VRSCEARHRCGHSRNSPKVQILGVEAKGVANSVGVGENLRHTQPGEIVMVTRTTHRSSTGKKLYAVRDAKGRFKDIQTYERAHRADLAKKSKSEKTKKSGG